MKSKKYGKILAALLCAGLLAGWHAPPVFAVDITVTVTEENQTEIQGTVELADTDIDTAVIDEKNQSVAIGTNAEAGGKRSTVIGYDAESNHFANDATVIGYGAKAENNNYATVLGAKAYTNHLNSVAIGYGSKTSKSGTVSFGYLGKNNIGAPDYRNLEGIEDVYVNGGIIFTANGAVSNADLAQGELQGVTKINGVQYSSDANNNTYSIGNIVFGTDGTTVQSINGISFGVDNANSTYSIGNIVFNANNSNVQNIGSIEFDSSGNVTSINGKNFSDLENSSGNVDGEDIKPNSVTTNKVTVGDADSGTQTVIDGTGTVMTKNEGGFTSTTTMDGSSTVMTMSDGSTTSKTTTQAGSTIMTKTDGNTTNTTTTEAGSIKVSSETTSTDGSKETSSVSIADGDIELSKTGADGKQQTIKVGEEISSIRGDMDSMRSDINAMGRSIDRLGEEIDEVGALSAALAGLHPNPINANSRADFAMAVGSYDGESAIAAGAFYRPDKRTMLSLGASATSGNQMFNVGVTFALDKLPEKENTNSEVLAAVMARLEKLEAENAQLRAQYAELKEQTAQ